MNIILAVLAVFIMWFLILNDVHREFIRGYIITWLKVIAIVAGAIGLYYLNEWQYKRDHTIFISDPKKSSFDQH